MKTRLGLFLATALLTTPCAVAQLADVAESHIEANVPDAKDFRAFLIRDLTAYLKPQLSDGVTLDYELLRDGPSQTGIAYPKFYLWVTVAKPEKLVVDGVARVAAIEKKGFQVTVFIPRADIIANPDILASVFPQSLLDKVRSKAGVKE